MPKISAEFVHFTFDVSAISEPIQDRVDGKTVSQIVDARAATVAVEGLRGSQTDISADLREVVTCSAVTSRFTIFLDEEPWRLRLDQPIPQTGI